MNGYSIKGLTKNYKVDGKIHRVLDKIDLNISSEIITVIIGRSGCGKTTLLRLLSHLERPTKGVIEFYNREKKVNPKIGMVFQESRLLPWNTVRENITFYLKGRDKELEDKYLSLMQLEKFSEAYPYQLSGGMAHRVAIARALSYDPYMLFMDEPFSQLDYFTRYDLQQEIIRLYEKTKIGIIFVTHNIDEALLLGHKIIILDKGIIKKQYTISNEYPRDLSELNQIKQNILKNLCMCEN